MNSCAQLTMLLFLGFGRRDLVPGVLSELINLGEESYFGIKQVV